jgi:hypothetical protein
MIKVYVYGCSSCGINAVWVRKVQAYGLKKGIEVLIINSKYNEQARQDHAYHLTNAGLSVDNYLPIVVEGDTVKELRGWS